MQRVFSLGHKEVMVIHTYYSNLLEMLSRLEVKTLADQQADKRHHTGQLATAVISATVRDVSRAENVPVSVQYTLSSGITAEYSKQVTPVCVFWNIMAGHASAWSKKGCRALPSPPDVTSCFCNHTTNFAVLMNYMEHRRPLLAYKRKRALIVVFVVCIEHYVRSLSAELHNEQT
ncbi:adhesion G protein-coupled receptor L4-like [Sinocyclocheilus anshuiensis]|uniref:adhesion G protein-coupled receptor L4-like n=1 Tax=Sinocyclocheilus anshuiensis TaxID=1608454 RepID=UPI0007BA0287|nr:PREDICTED: adhesion G protein-coupled receptor L4-like [Sinocyclocheilus anshuiensis]